MKHFIYWLFPLLLWYVDWPQSEGKSQNSSTTEDKKPQREKAIKMFEMGQIEEQGQ